MKNKNLYTLFLLMAFVGVLFVTAIPQEISAQTLITSETVESHNTWTRVNSPYVVEGLVYFPYYRRLQIEAGVVVKFTENSRLIVPARSGPYIYGTSENPVYFTSIKDDSVGGDTNTDGSATTPSAGDWGYASFGSGSRNTRSDINYLKVRYGGGVPVNSSRWDGEVHPALIIFYNGYTGTPGKGYELKNIQVSESIAGLYVHVGFNNGLNIKESSFYNNEEYGVQKRTYYHNWHGDWTGGLNLNDNWWGDTSGPYHSDLNPEGLGNAVTGTRTYFDSWLSEDPMPDVLPKDGNSSVAFIPGLQASRLYVEANDGKEHQLWEPSKDSDGKNLYMNEFGESIHNVYTKDVIDEALGAVNIYKSFIKEMDDLVEEGVIAEWKALPYDWRYNVFDVVRGDVKNSPDTTYNMVAEIKKLAQNSDSGKVTLITHSNGGLVAKALISELEAQGEAGIIDNLVLVAVPQLGTPKAIASILHGDGQGKGFGPMKLLTRETARELGKNMPGGYGLLPSEGYFDKVSDPVVVFDEDSSTTSVLRGRYGNEIDNASELDSFMIGRDVGRNDPDRDDLLTPILANNYLLNIARDGQKTLDNWTLPEGVEVTEIVGWGIPTLNGVKYQDKERIVCGEFESECTKEIIMDHTPVQTFGGDKTVIAESASVMGGIDKYFLKLLESNDGLRRNRKHSDILEVDSVLYLLNSIIKGEEITILPQFITKTKPSISETGDNLRLSVHSPVSIGITDDNGNFTGVGDDSDLIEIREDIPNSSYLSFGDGKYVNVPKGENYDVEILGQDTGIFTFNIEHISGDDVEGKESFVNMPVTKEMRAHLKIDSNGDAKELSLDVNGDGESDVTLNAGEDFSSTAYVAILRKMIENSSINKGISNSLLVRLDNLERELEKERGGKGKGNSVDSLLHSMIQSLQDQNADDIIKIINILREVL